MLESKKNNISEQLCSDITLPKMIRVRQRFDESHIKPEDIPAAVFAQMSRDALKQAIRPGMQIGITCGSRGIANISLIIKSLADFVKECGASPFLFPAMGSHGGATASGQLAILKSYQITEESIGCPIRATMDTVYLGDTEEGSPVYIDRIAHEADGILLCGRIKAHTAFRGPFESGLVKMAVIGMGKQHGADAVHESGFINMGRVLPQFGRVIFEHANILGGLGILENAFEQTYRLEGLSPEEIWEKEPELLKLSKTKLGRIWIEKADVLVVDRIGKNYSGDGMDPNVSGTFASPESACDGMPGPIQAQRTIVLDLSDETHGNANGIGMADITTRRLVSKMDIDATYPNAVTSTLLNIIKIPFLTHSDKNAIRLGVRSCNGIDKSHPRIVRIANTMELERIWVSESLIEEVMRHPNMEIDGELEDWQFDEDGNLW